MSRYTHEGELTESGAVPTHIYCCTECGAAVISQWQHDVWHRQVEAIKTKAWGF